MFNDATLWAVYVQFLAEFTSFSSSLTDANADADECSALLLILAGGTAAAGWEVWNTVCVDRQVR